MNLWNLFWMRSKDFLVAFSSSSRRAICSAGDKGGTVHSQMKVKPEWITPSSSQTRWVEFRLLHFQSKTLAVGVELWSVHALDVGHTSLVLAAVLDANRVFEDVGAFG